MKFDQAYRWLRRGKCIRRTGWASCCHIEHSQGEQVRHYNGRRWIGYVLLMRDLFDDEGQPRDDWEVMR